MTIDEAIAAIERSAPDPTSGLPEDVFLLVSRITPLINVDLLIQDEHRGTLLTWRDDEHFHCGWHVPGGIIRYKEPAADRIRKCAEEEIGAAVEFEPKPLLITETIRSERTRGHFISMLYRCRLRTEPDAARGAGEPPRRGEWKWHSRFPDDLIQVQRVYAPYFRIANP